MAPLDLSKDQILLDWFQRHCWSNPTDDWLKEHHETVGPEIVQVDRELQRRLDALRSGTVDDAIFWVGLATAIAGGAALLFPPAGIPALIGHIATLGGLGTGVAGAARKLTSTEAIEWVNALRLDLKTLHRRISAL